MFGAVIREYYRNPEINQGKKLESVSIMPCTAKKEEILRPESMTNGRQDVDYVLTTTEVASMIRKSGIRFENIDGESTDMPFGIGSGGGAPPPSDRPQPGGNGSHPHQRRPGR